MTKLNKRPDGGKLLYRILSSRIGSIGAVVLGISLFIGFIVGVNSIPEETRAMILAVVFLVGFGTFFITILGLSIWYLAYHIKAWAEEKLDD